MSKNRNALLGGSLAGVMLGMVGLSFAAVPLYRLFCQATGFGGTPIVGGPSAPGATGRTITVRFNADTKPGLPWRFTASQNQLTVGLG